MSRLMMDLQRAHQRTLSASIGSLELVFNHVESHLGSIGTMLHPVESSLEAIELSSKHAQNANSEESEPESALRGTIPFSEVASQGVEIADVAPVSGDG